MTTPSDPPESVSDADVARETLSRDIREAFGPEAAFLRMRFRHHHKARSTLSMTVLTAALHPIEPSASTDVFTLLDRAETVFSEGLHRLHGDQVPPVQHRSRDATFDKLKRKQLKKEEKS